MFCIDQYTSASRSAEPPVVGIKIFFWINLAANMPECILREIIEGTRYVFLQKFRQCSMFKRQILLLHNGFLLHVVVTIKMHWCCYHWSFSTWKLQAGTLADSGGPDEMLHRVAFRQGLLCLKILVRHHYLDNHLLKCTSDIWILAQSARSNEMY